MAAVAGVAVAIGAAGSVVGRSFVTLLWLTDHPTDQVAADVNADTELLGGLSNCGDLYDRVVDARQELSAAMADWTQQPTEERWKVVGDKETVVGYYDAVVARVLAQASYAKLRETFNTARWVMLLGAVLAAGGIAAFAWAANPPATSEVEVPVVVASPTEVTVTFTAAGVAAHRDALGADCDLTKPVAAVAVADAGAAHQLVILPRAGCPVSLLTVTAEEATVVPAGAGDGG